MVLYLTENGLFCFGTVLLWYVCIKTDDSEMILKGAEKMFGWILLAAVGAFLAVLLVRTLRFRPADRTAVAAQPVELDGDRVVDSLARMVRCKTVSYRDKALVDEREFEKFRALLAERYPNVHRVCELERTASGEGQRKFAADERGHDRQRAGLPAQYR